MGKARPRKTVKPASHYKTADSDFECIDAIEQQELNFNMATAFRYIWRAGRKAGNTKEADIEKAIDYLHRELYGTWFERPKR